MGCTVGLVEDEDIIRENYADFLVAHGFGVRPFSTRAIALTAFRAEPPDIAVLDVALGDERDGGLLLCSDLRRFSPCLPVIFLTCHDQEADRILGLRLGADDYISKEASLDFLLVRIETLLERQRRLTQANTVPAKREALRLGALTIAIDRTEVYWKQQRVELTLTHYWMVLALASDAYRPKSWSDLMKAANICVAPNTIAAHIRSIRARFAAVDPEFDAIRTERGHGYRWLLH